MKALKNFNALLVILAVFAMFSLSSVTFADEKNITVNVSISAIAQITVTPTDLVWGLLTPGSVGGYKNLSIKSTGSLNISTIYAFTDTLYTEDARPYAASTANDYSAGGVVVLVNQSVYEASGGPFWFTSRLEWNQSEPVPNALLSNIKNPVAYGFFRNATHEYFWTVGNGSEDGGDNYCNSTGAQFAFDSDDDLGTADTRTPTTTDVTFNGGDEAGWGYFSVTRASSPLFGYCIAVNYTCNKIYIYKFDKRDNFGSKCDNVEYLRSTKLVPGAIEKTRIDVYIPYGVPAGNMTQTKLTFMAA